MRHLPCGSGWPKPTDVHMMARDVSQFQPALDGESNLQLGAGDTNK